MFVALGVYEGVNAHSHTEPHSQTRAPTCRHAHTHKHTNEGGRYLWGLQRERTVAVTDGRGAESLRGTIKRKYQDKILNLMERKVYVYIAGYSAPKISRNTNPFPVEFTVLATPHNK